jgi:hypothetical protein
MRAKETPVREAFSLSGSAAAALLLCLLATTSQAQDFSLLGTGFDSHVELAWEKPQNQNPVSYKVWRSSDGQNFTNAKTVNLPQAMDFTGYPGSTPDNYYYCVTALNGVNAVIASSDTIQVSVAEMTDEELLDMVQEYTFRYFWNFAHPVSGLARERNTSGDIVTSGGSGFGIMAIIAGIERGYITRLQGLNRLLQLVSFLQIADSFHGVFPHWMNGNNGNTVPFSQFDNGADLVETAFLMQGLLCARSYFDLDDPYEEALRDAVTGLWEAVEWDFFRKNNSGVLYWHWSPNYAWQMNFPIRGFNESMIVYILAIASPSHPVPASLWNTGWAASNYASGASWYGYELEVGPSMGGPLFFSHYSYLGFDPRNKRDAFANYFLRNRNHTLINRAYCMANPLNHPGYSEVCWGLTASDNPWGYLAHEPGAGKDNGTITPTAALSSMPYTPAESIAALKHFYRDRGDKLWGPMGFYDAFNQKANWYADSYLAIDQGPIVAMIENYRTGLFWDLFMANPEIQPALDAIGFVEDLTTDAAAPVHEKTALQAYPNPGQSGLNIRFFLEKSQLASLELLNLQGQVLRLGANDQVFEAGWHTLSMDSSDLPGGLYLLRLKGETEAAALKWVKQ